MNNTFNLRNPQPGEVNEIYQKAQQRRLAKERYRVLSQLLAGKRNVDVTVSPEIFEALNRERMEFEELMKLSHNQVDVNNCIEAVIEDREKYHTDGRWWNPKSKSKLGCLGHIPHCVYYSRPQEYWEDFGLLKNFFNQFPKFRVSTKPL